MNIWVCRISKTEYSMKLQSKLRHHYHIVRLSRWVLTIISPFNSQSWRNRLTSNGPRPIWMKTRLFWGPLARAQSKSNESDIHWLDLIFLCDRKSRDKKNPLCDVTYEVFKTPSYIAQLLLPGGLAVNVILYAYITYPHTYISWLDAGSCV